MKKGTNTRISGRAASTRPQDVIEDDGRWEKYWPVYRDAASRSIGGGPVDGSPYGLMAVIDQVEKDVRELIARGYDDILQGATRELEEVRRSGAKFSEGRVARLEEQIKLYRNLAHGARNPIRKLI